MQVRLLVERGQQENVVRLAGMSYTFKKNDYGHLVAEITDPTSLEWVANARNTSFVPYEIPKDSIVSTTTEENVTPPIEAKPVIPEIPEGENYAPPRGRFDAITSEEIKNVREEKFICPECKKVFDSERKMKGHLGGAHRKE